MQPIPASSVGSVPGHSVYYPDLQKQNRNRNRNRNIYVDLTEVQSLGEMFGQWKG